MFVKVLIFGENAWKSMGVNLIIVTKICTESSKHICVEALHAHSHIGQIASKYNANILTKKEEPGIAKACL